MVTSIVKKKQKTSKRAGRTAARKGQVASERPAVQQVPDANAMAYRLDVVHDKVGEALSILAMIQDSVMLIQERNEGEGEEIPLHDLHHSMQTLRGILRDAEERAQWSMCVGPEGEEDLVLGEEE
jgi:hypothetical protein